MDSNCGECGSLLICETCTEVETVKMHIDTLVKAAKGDGMYSEIARNMLESYSMPSVFEKMLGGDGGGETVLIPRVNKED